QLICTEVTLQIVTGIFKTPSYVYQRRLRVAPGAYPPRRTPACPGAPGLLQGSGVTPRSEPTIDGGQQVVGLGARALRLPQTTEAPGGPQLPRLREVLEGHAQPRIVLDDEHQCLGVRHAPSSLPLGSVNCTTAPWGTFAVAHSRPPWASIIRRLIA